jgi:hypothetical protein
MTAKFTDTELDALLALEAKATPPPWDPKIWGVASPDCEGYWARAIGPMHAGRKLGLETHTRAKADAAFLAPARSAFRSMARELLALRALLRDTTRYLHLRNDPEARELLAGIEAAGMGGKG